MVYDIKQFIADLLNNLFPDKTVVDESIPQGSEANTFLITIAAQEYSKLISNRFRSNILVDISYYPGSEESPGDECLGIQQDVLRALAVNTGYRVANLKANIVDNILHITFSVSYRELKVTEGVAMQQKQINTSI